jgi:hypothetical protein
MARKTVILVSVSFPVFLPGFFPAIAIVGGRRLLILELNPT